MILVKGYQEIPWAADTTAVRLRGIKKQGQFQIYLHLDPDKIS